VRDAHPAANFPVLISKPALFVQDHRPYDERAKQNCQRADRVSSHEPTSHAERKGPANDGHYLLNSRGSPSFKKQDYPAEQQKLRQA